MRRTNRLMLLLLLAGCSRQSIQVSAPKTLLPIPPAAPPVLFHEPFDQLDPTRWREIEVKGRTRYRLDKIEGISCLKAHSVNGASILLYPIRFDPDEYDWISWRWRIRFLLNQEDLTKRAKSDAAARIYVFFDSKGLPWQKRNLNYVWSTSQPEGAVLPSTFSNASRAIVVESGPEHVRTWRSESRNIEDDYRRCFGEDPPDVVGIGIMTDTDNTGAEAIAWYDEIVVSRHRPSLEGRRGSPGTRTTPAPAGQGGRWPAPS